MKNPFSNETVKSAAIVIGSAAAFIALSKGVSILRKKFGGKNKLQPIFGAQEKAEKAAKPLWGSRNEPLWGSRNESAAMGKSAVSDCVETDSCECEASR